MPFKHQHEQLCGYTKPYITSSCLNISKFHISLVSLVVVFLGFTAVCSHMSSAVLYGWQENLTPLVLSTAVREEWWSCLRETGCPSWWRSWPHQDSHSSTRTRWRKSRRSASTPPQMVQDLKGFTDLYLCLVGSSLPLPFRRLEMGPESLQSDLNETWAQIVWPHTYKIKLWPIFHKPHNLYVSNISEHSDMKMPFFRRRKQKKYVFRSVSSLYYIP